METPEPYQYASEFCVVEALRLHRKHAWESCEGGEYTVCSLWDPFRDFEGERGRLDGMVARGAREIAV